MNRIPQDAPQNFKQGPSLEEQVESLEQALSIQISKRIEAEHRLKSIHTIQSDLSDLEDILDSFISEIDGLDGDDSEALMERKDILWFVHEIKHRVKDITSNLSSSPVDSSDVVEEEKNIAKLQGHVSSMKETIEKLTKHGEFQSMEEESANAYDKFQMAQENYSPTENRRGAALKEMQESLSEKNKEILILKQRIEQCTCRNHAENGHDVFHHETETTHVPSPGDFEESPSQNGNDRPNFDSPRRDSFIQSLKEDVEKRDKIIEDLRTELDTYIQAKQPVEQQCSQSQEPSTRIRYLERIIRELEQKLSPNGRYGTIGFYAPDPLCVDDLELQIAELTERLEEQKLIENKRNSRESNIDLNLT